MSEQDRVLGALETAIEMELDGKACYLAASEGSRNSAGRQLLRSLAEEEEHHRLRFSAIYDSVRRKMGWPVLEPKPGRASDIRSTLRQACNALGADVSSTAGELEALRTAIDKEKKSYDFYERQAKDASYASEKVFYNSLAEEEREHELTLLDYDEYLADPAGWFVKKEHPSLDGG
jgi:rubrerythrin